MTPQEIRAAIVADPAIHALVPDTEALAAALSVGRTRTVPTEVGKGVIIETLGLASGNTLCDLIDGTADYRHIRHLLTAGTLRLDSPLVVATLQSLAGTVLTQAEVDALLKLTQAPDPVSEFEVRCAIYADDGTLLV